MGLRGLLVGEAREFEPGRLAVASASARTSSEDSGATRRGVDAGRDAATLQPSLTLPHFDPSILDVAIDGLRLSAPTLRGQLGRHATLLVFLRHLG